MYLNKVILYGNLTRDPELKALPGGQTVASFSVATNRTFKNKEGVQQDQTEYHNVVAFGRTADIIGQYIKKGRAIFVEGRLQTRSWDKEGVKQYRTEVVCDTFQFGADSGAGDRPRASAPSATAARHPLEGEFDEEINPEDIPF